MLTTDRSAAICYVEKKFSDANIAIAHVYCNYKESNTQLASHVWSSVARQFAEQCNPFPPEFQDFSDNFIKRRSKPTETDLISLIRSLSGLFTNSFVFIDALVCHNSNTAA